MDAGDLDGLADALYREAKLELDEPVNPAALARTLLGSSDAVQVVPPHALKYTRAQLAFVSGEWRIYVRRDDRPTMAFNVAHELAHWALRREGYDGDNEERDADYLGAAIIAPRRAFGAAVRIHGRDYVALAEAFGTTESLAALRFGEATSTPLALVRPGLVRVRSQLSFVWPDEGTITRWARGAVPRGLVKTRLTDDPRRVLLVAGDE